MKLNRYIHIVAICLLSLFSLTIQARPMLIPGTAAISSDGTGELKLKNTETGITSYQTDVYLPNGITMTSVALSNNSTDHQCVFAQQADGAYRIIVSSQTLAELPEQELKCRLSAPVTSNVSGKAYLRNTVMVYTSGSKGQRPETMFFVADRANKLSASVSMETENSGTITVDFSKVEGLAMVTGIQMDVMFGESMTPECNADGSLKATCTDSNHTVASERQYDGSYRIVVSSMGNSVFADSKLFTLPFSVNEEMYGQASSVAWANITYVLSDGTKTYAVDDYASFELKKDAPDLPTDMTSSLTNPNFDNGKTGWEGSNFTVGGRSDNPCAETWNSQAFDVYQTLTGLPNGRYLVTCQGFYRAGSYVNAANSRNNGTEEHYGYLYANNEQVALRSILDVGKEGLDYANAGGISPQATVSYDGGTYKLPDNMNAASYAFSNGVSLNKLEVNVTDGTLRIGIKKTGYISADWVIFDDFHLYKIDGTAEETVKVGSISLSSSSLSMVVGNTTTLSASVSPSDATDKSLTWTSSAPSVVTVSASGVVTAVAAGTATITATANDGSGVSATCMVVVDTEKPCAKPVIVFAGGKITLSCSTPDAVCHYSYTITPTSGDGTGDASITPEIVITAYATANGYSQSDSITESFPLSGSDDLKGDVNGDGKLSIADANAIVNIVLGK